MKSTAAGFSRDRVRKFFNLLERTEHKVKAIIIYAYNVDETALKHFRRKPKK
jgi:hypothetical protein